MTEFIDVFPTLCELTGLAPPQGLDGKSLTNLMRGERPMKNKPSVSQYLRNTDDGLVMGWAIRTPRYRYVEWRRTRVENLQYTHSGQGVGCELYDYQVDPNETRNLAASVEHRGVLAKMAEEFDKVLPDLPERNEDI